MLKYRYPQSSLLLRGKYKPFIIHAAIHAALLYESE